MGNACRREGKAGNITTLLNTHCKTHEIYLPYINKIIPEIIKSQRRALATDLVRQKIEYLIYKTGFFF